MVKYTRLWETMQRKGISQYRLIKTYGISNGQLNRLRKNLYISTHTVETLCRILDCRVEDVMEIVFDESDELLWSPGLEEERQKAGGAGEEKEEAGTVKLLCGKIWCITDCGNATVCGIVSRSRL